MRYLIAVLASVLIAPAAFAATGLNPDLFSGGAALDHISGPGIEYELIPIQFQYGYTHDISNRLSIHTAHRVLAAPGNENEPAAYVNELSVIASYDAGRGFRPFIGALNSLWGDGITGSAEDLYGFTAGMAFPLEGNTYMTVGYRGAWDVLGRSKDLSQQGIIFGPTFTFGG